MQERIGAYQCRAGTERRLGIHGRAGKSFGRRLAVHRHTSRVRVQGAYSFDKGELFSCFG
jgi:hypothetical protein